MLFHVCDPSVFQLFFASLVNAVLVFEGDVNSGQPIAVSLFGDALMMRSEYFDHLLSGQ